jgi:hypothetical protein
MTLGWPSLIRTIFHRDRGNRGVEVVITHYVSGSVTAEVVVFVCSVRWGRQITRWLIPVDDAERMGKLLR